LPRKALFEEAVVEVNRLCPDFVVVIGDLGHNNMDATEIAEVKRIAEGITASIPIYWLPGNRDTSFDGETAKSELLKRYRDEFGPDYHAFVHKEVAFICLSSTVIYDPSETPGEWEAQLEFIRGELQASRSRQDHRRIIFSHHPLFTGGPEDEDAGSHLPRERRGPLLDLFREYDVSAETTMRWTEICRWSRVVPSGCRPGTTNLGIAS
jgi:3',5'-cyclic AMP phosphodiesterase CpdA